MELSIVGYSHRFQISEKQEKIIHNANFKIVAMVSTVGDLLNAVIDDNPSVVVIDLAMNPSDVFLDNIIETIYNNFNKNIVVITEDLKDIYKNYYCVDCLYWKVGVVRILNKIGKKKLCIENNVHTLNISNAIATQLVENNFSASYLGYHYLAKAIEICYERNGFIKNLTTEIYSVVAKTFNTNYKNVERNIRHAIKCAVNISKDTHSKNYEYTKRLTTCTNRKLIFSFANSILIKSRSNSIN